MARKLGGSFHWKTRMLMGRSCHWMARKLEGGGLSLEDQDADGEKAAASSQHDRQAPDRSGLGRFKSVR